MENASWIISIILITLTHPSNPILASHYPIHFGILGKFKCLFSLSPKLSLPLKSQNCL